MQHLGLSLREPLLLREDLAPLVNGQSPLLGSIVFICAVDQNRRNALAHAVDGFLETEVLQKNRHGNDKAKHDTSHRQNHHLHIARPIVVHETAGIGS